MDFSLSKKHLLMQELFRTFAEKEVKPIAAEIDETEEFPYETATKLGKYGMMGIPFPKEYNGSGADNLAYAMCVEELSKVCATTGIVVSAHSSLCAAPINDFGTPFQKEKYLTKLAGGEWIGAFGLTEAGSGSDVSGQQTTAVLDGDNYILNGTKIFITNADAGHVYIIIAVTDKTQGTRGLSCFIVEKDYPGFSIGKKEKKLGIKGSSTCELIMEDCIVPKENLIGKEGQGFKIAMHTLNGGRMGVAAQALGIAQGAIDITVDYVRERKQFNKRISQFQNTQFELADMQTTVDAARLLVYRSACLKDKKQNYSKEAAMAKLFASEAASDITRRCLQLHGGYGYTREYPIERMMRDAKITEIYEGTSEVQKMVIAAAMKVN